MNLDVSSGSARVIASGQVTTFFGNDLTLTLGADAITYTVVMTFVEDPDAPGVAVRTTQDEATLRLELVNFDDASGRGTSEPLLIGAHGEELWFLHFRAFRFGRTADHTVHYTFYATSEQAVGFRRGDAGAAPTRPNPPNPTLLER